MIKINLHKSIKLSAIHNTDCINKSGIYFHCVKISNGLLAIIYVGKCDSFSSRQKQHYENYINRKYSLFKLTYGELNIVHIADYDDINEETDFLIKENLDSIFVVFGEIIENSMNHTLKSIEGAIINLLFREDKTRKFMLNNSRDYSLHHNQIRFYTSTYINLIGLDIHILQ